jgi:hypothetical protein
MGETQGRGPRAGTGIEHALAGRGRHGCRQENRVDGHAVAAGRLQKLDATAEQTVVGQPRRGHLFIVSSSVWFQ